MDEKDHPDCSYKAKNKPKKKNSKKKADSWTEACCKHKMKRTGSEKCKANGELEPSFKTKSKYWMVFKTSRMKTLNQRLRKDEIKRERNNDRNNKNVLLNFWTIANGKLGLYSPAELLMGRRHRLKLDELPEWASEEGIAHREFKLTQLKDFKRTRRNIGKKARIKGEVSRQNCYFNVGKIFY